MLFHQYNTSIFVYIYFKSSYFCTESFAFIKKKKCNNNETYKDAYFMKNKKKHL